MIKKLFRRISRSLNVKMLFWQLLALTVAALVFLGVSSAGRYAVENIYMSAESVASRKASIYSQFSSYVTANLVSGNDTAAIARWTRQHSYVTIVIYTDESVAARVSGGRVANPGPSPVPDSQYGKLYPMRFADGVYQIAIGDTSENRELAVNTVLALILASIAYVAIQTHYTGRLTRRIVSLSREAAEISAGDLESPIAAKGSDEIAALARDVDTMRRSVIERMGNERRAWEANSELITAISHDIRTPMTSLIGYLGLLKERNLPEEQRSQFTASAYDKAMELKSLTDELFRYFLVFGRADLELNMEKLDARLLLEQLLGEAEFDLRDSGFEVQRIEFEGECSVSADPMYLKRVLDNLISNIKKYADPAKPVVMQTEHRDGTLYIRFSNAVARRMDRVESTKIGLRTCEKIMAHMNGSFRAGAEGSGFTAELSLPVQELI
ncbi:MAG: HAMP domain-containing histidine kinase [Oscillospiraceae bacterium]|nr:HAMP domain-containing histidine kinase [Oscillospiraceae bacterium]